MFRSIGFSSRLSASMMAVAKAKAPNKGVIKGFQGVSRMLAGRPDRLGTIQQYTTVISSAPKTASTVVAVIASHLGRAAVLLNRRANELALRDIQAAAELLKGADSAKGAILGELAGLAAALRLKVDNFNLDEAESKLVLSGAGNEKEVSGCRQAVRTSLEELSKERPACLMVKIAKADNFLGEGNNLKAAGAIDEAIKGLEELLKRGAGSTEIASTEAVKAEGLEAASLIAYQVACGGTPEGGAVKALREALGLPVGVSEGEICALAAVLNAAASSHNYVDFFFNTDGYRLWESEPAKKLAASLDQIGGNLSHNLNIEIAKFNPLKPSKVFPPNESTNKAALSKLIDESVKEAKPVIETIEEKLGRVPENSKSKKDEEFLSILNKLDEVVAKSASPIYSAEFLRSTYDELIEQLLCRAKITKALVLERQGNFPAGIEILNQVIDGNKYIHMWKALLARGRMLRAYGKPDVAEVDFKRLHSMKLSPKGYDIPMDDENRVKNVF